MTDDIVLGIDLGTTNSVVAVADAGEARVLADLDGKRLIPSVVSFEGNQVHVGDVARERRLKDAENTIYAMKRLIGRPYDSEEVRRARERFAFEIIEGENGGIRVVARGEGWALAEISAYVLRECRRIAEQVLDRECRRVVITVPANFNELQRSATKAAGTIAGLDVVRILNEPTAAAVAYGCGASGAERAAVFDFGGGTFDITILDLDDDVFEVVATAGDTFLGGDDIDLQIAEEMAFAFERDTGVDPRPDPQAFERLRAAGEWVKCQLSFQEDITAKLAEVMVDGNGEPMPLAYRMTRTQLEARVRPLVERAMAVTSEALGLGGVTVKDIDTVVLVGGSTRIPLVRSMVAEYFGRAPRVDLDPDLVVALGAAVQGYSLSHKRPRKTITVFPSVEAVDALKRKKASAKAARPDQPAFAPQNYHPPQPSGGTKPGGSRAPGPPEPEAPSSPPLELSPEDLEEVYADDVRPLSKIDIASALFNVGPSTAPAATAPPVSIAAFAATDPGLGRPPETSDPASPSAPHLDPSALALDPSAQGTEAPLTLALPEPGGPALSGASLIELPEPPDRTPAPSPAPRLRGKDLFDLPAPLTDGAPAIVGAAYENPAEGEAFINMPASVPPILMDVTPHSLGIQTVGGYCERVIRGNTPIPVEQTRIFTTAKDNQETVEISICQGESRAYADNQHLGKIELSGLPGKKRGEVRIQVTFMLDADGRLDVDAANQGTSQSQRIRINLVGGYDDGQLEEMRERQEQNQAG